MSDRDRLEEELDRLPREVEPPRDLWPGIRRRITPDEATGAGNSDVEKRRRRGWPAELVAAAAAIVVFLAGWGVAKLGPGLDAGGNNGGVAADGVSEGLDAEYVAALNQLLGTLESGGIPPETVALIRRDLAAMDEAVNGFQVALAERPDDPHLQKQLNTEVRRRHNVLRRIADIQIAGLQLGGNE